MLTITEIDKILKDGLIMKILGRPDFLYQKRSALKYSEEFKNWDIRISNSFNTNNDLKNIKNIKFFNTKSHQKYLKFLSSCEAILILANKKDYFYRNSGSIMDSISCGAVPIVPRFPVFISQINKPVKIGFAYKSLEKINEVLSIFNTLIPALIKNRKRYFSERRIVNIDLLN
jgi:hypothetical protein